MSLTSHGVEGSKLVDNEKLSLGDLYLRRLTFKPSWYVLVCLGFLYVPGTSQKCVIFCTVVVWGRSRRLGPLFTGLCTRPSLRSNLDFQRQLLHPSRPTLQSHRPALICRAGNSYRDNFQIYHNLPHHGKRCGKQIHTHGPKACCRFEYSSIPSIYVQYMSGGIQEQRAPARPHAE